MHTNEIRHTSVIINIYNSLNIINTTRVRARCAFRQTLSIQLVKTVETPRSSDRLMILLYCYLLNLKQQCSTILLSKITIPSIKVMEWISIYYLKMVDIIVCKTIS